MRVRLLACSALVVFGSAALVAPAASAGMGAAPGRGVQPLPTPCQSNINPADDTGQSLPAQNLPGGLNSSGATLVKLSSPCSLTYVTAYGKLSGTGPVTKVNVAVRADITGGPLGHKPGTVLAGYANWPATGTTSGPYYVVTTTIPTFALASGTYYWVQMQVRMNSALGKWTWEVVRPDPAGNSDEWRNPAGGFGCGSGWKVVSLACMGAAPGKGLMTEVGT